MFLSLLSSGWAESSSALAPSLALPELVPLYTKALRCTNEVRVRLESPGVAYQVGEQILLFDVNPDSFVGIRHDETQKSNELIAFPRLSETGDGSAWITNEKQLIFGYRTASTPGMLVIRRGEFLPVLEETRDAYVVLMTRFGRETRLRLSKNTGSFNAESATPPPELFMAHEMAEAARQAEAAAAAAAAAPPPAPKPILPASIARAQRETRHAPAPVVAAAATDTNKVAPAPAQTAGTALTGMIARATPPAKPALQVSPPIAAPPVEKEPMVELAVAPAPAPGAPPAAPTPPATPVAPVAPAAPITNAQVAVAPPAPVAPQPLPVAPSNAVAVAPAPAAPVATPAPAVVPATPAPATAATQVVAAATAPPAAALSNKLASAAAQKPKPKPESEEPPSTISSFFAFNAWTFWVLLITIALEGAMIARLMLRRKSEVTSADTNQVYSFSSVGESVLDVASQSFVTSSNGDLQGDLDKFSMGHVVQFFHSSGESGTLTVTGPNGRTDKLVFDRGQIIDAVCGNRCGDDAAEIVLRRRQGSFKFTREDNSTRLHLINRDTMGLLMESARLIDEKGWAD